MALRLVSGADADGVSETTFTRWLNAEAARVAKSAAKDAVGDAARADVPPPLNDLTEDASSGWKLLRAFACMYPESAPAKLGVEPKGRIGALDAAQRALDYTLPRGG